MENKLIKLELRYQELKEELQHSGYSGIFLENHILEVMSNEILSNIDKENEWDEMKKALTHMYYLGQLRELKREAD